MTECIKFGTKCNECGHCQKNYVKVNVCTKRGPPGPTGPPGFAGDNINLDGQTLVISGGNIVFGSTGTSSSFTAFGKINFPGVVDPTAIVFTNTTSSSVPVPSGSGAIYVSAGGETSISNIPIPANVPVYKNGSGSLYDLLAGEATSHIIDDDSSTLLTVAGVVKDSAQLSAAGGFWAVQGLSGSTSSPSMPYGGTGVRMFWWQPKGAFRAGAVQGSGWDDVNIGAYSTSFGFNVPVGGTASSGEGYGFSFGDSGGATVNNLFIPVSNPYFGAQGFAGHVEGIFTNTGVTSTGCHAEGISTYASNEASHAEGYVTTSSAFGTHAEGIQTIASALSAHAEGINSVASGNVSHAEGNQTTASGTASHAEGTGTVAVGDSSHVEGSNNTANGGNSHVEGSQNVADGPGSHAEGEGTHAIGEASHVEGQGTIAFDTGAHAEGVSTNAFGAASHAEGSGNTAQGVASHVEGGLNVAFSDYTHTEGFQNFSSGLFSHVQGLGNTSAGIASHIGGVGNTNNCDFSFTQGLGLANEGSTGVNLFGINGQSRTGGGSGSNPIYAYSIQLAGGASPGVSGVGLILYTTTFGDVPTAQGVANAWLTGGADYAEYFEWADGNPNGEDRTGKFVRLTNGGKIEISPDSNVIGIVSGTQGVLGDAAELAWQGCNLKDKYLRTVTKESYKLPVEGAIKSSGLLLSNHLFQVSRSLPDDASLAQSIISACQVHSLEHKEDDHIYDSLIAHLRGIAPVRTAVLNPQYDSTISYVPRSQRKEWSPVGLMGKIVVDDNGTLKSGDRCDCVNGAAVRGSRWIVLRRVSENTVQILYK